MTNATLAVIGSGNMGTSLIGGLIAKDYPADKMWVTDPSAEKLSAIKKQFNVHTTADNNEAVKAASVVILAVKPQHLAAVSQEIAASVQAHKPLIISIAAGVREASLQTWLGGNCAIVRTMPNTPALIGCGATALFANKHVTHAQKELAESMLRAVGLIVWLEQEALMDTVTALSGSGPAYFFLIMESLQMAAEELGLPKEVARLLTLQTAYGAARMSLESDQTLTELRHHVTSPGGTTERGVNAMEEANIRLLLANTLKAAKKRSEELAELIAHPTEK